MAAQQVCPGTLQVIQRPGRRGGQQRQRRIERADLVLGLRRGQSPRHPPRRVERQRGRAFQKGGGRGESTTRLGAARRVLELGGDLLVGPERCLGAVPGTAIGIGQRVSGVGQRLVYCPPFGRRRGPVHRRPHQRMAERHPLADRQQPIGLRGRRRHHRDPEPFSRPPHQRWLAGQLRRRDKQQALRAGGQSLEPAPEAVLDPHREFRSLSQSEPGG